MQIEDDDLIIPETINHGFINLDHYSQLSFLVSYFYLSILI